MENNNSNASLKNCSLFVFAVFRICSVICHSSSSKKIRCSNLTLRLSNLFINLPELLDKILKNYEKITYMKTLEDATPNMHIIHIIIMINIFYK